MRIRESTDFPGPCEQVFAIRTSGAFQEQKLQRSGALEHSHEVQVEGEHTIVTTRRAMPTDQLPDVARKFVGDQLVIEERQDWGPAQADGARRAAVDIRVAGVPVTVTGTLALQPNGSGCRQELDGDLKAGIPFLGGKIEQAAAPAIAYGFRIESQLVTEQLAAGH